MYRHGLPTTIHRSHITQDFIFICWPNWKRHMNLLILRSLLLSHSTKWWMIWSGQVRFPHRCSGGRICITPFINDSMTHLFVNHASCVVEILMLFIIHHEASENEQQQQCRPWKWEWSPRPNPNWTKVSTSQLHCNW